MDFIYELEQLENNVSSQELIDDLEKEKIIFEEKIHTLQIIKFSEHFSQLLNTPTFKRSNASYFKFRLVPASTHIDIPFYLTDKDDNNIEFRYCAELYDTFNYLVNNLKLTHFDFFPTFIDHNWQTIALDEHIKGSLLKHFLSEKLQAVLNYSKMQLSLKKDKVHTEKISKV